MTDEPVVLLADPVSDPLPPDVFLGWVMVLLGLGGIVWAALMNTVVGNVHHTKLLNVQLMVTIASSAFFLAGVLNLGFARIRRSLSRPHA